MSHPLGYRIPVGRCISHPPRVPYIYHTPLGYRIPVGRGISHPLGYRIPVGRCTSPPPRVPYTSRTVYIYHTPPGPTFPCSIPPQFEYWRCHDGRHWQYLVESIPKACRSVLAPSWFVEQSSLEKRPRGCDSVIYTVLYYSNLYYSNLYYSNLYYSNTVPSFTQFGHCSSCTSILFRGGICYINRNLRWTPKLYVPLYMPICLLTIFGSDYYYVPLVL